MFLSQITSSSRISMSGLLASLRTNNMCRSHIKEFYKQQKALYCILKRQSEANAAADKVGQISNHNNAKINEYIQQCEDISSEKFNFHKSSKPLNVSDIKKLYPVPMTNLMAIYELVNNESGKQCITVSYEEMPNRTKKCSIDISWPLNMSFTHESSTKKLAGYNAALKCLQWLYQNKKIFYSKPVIYTKNEVKEILKLQQFIPIDLKLEFKTEIRSLLRTFENDIESVVSQRLSIDTEKRDREKEELMNQVHPSASEAKLGKRPQQRKSNINNLPIHNYREEILDSIDQNQILIIKGDTGCGKSTQIPQFIIDAYTEQGRAHECHIIASVPRRVAAVSLAHRVASERKENVGDVVGYHVRFNNVTPERLQNGSVVFCTAGILLRILESNPTLEGISHVVLDEVHERSIQSDILVKVLKDLLKNKPSMKLIIMSATMDVDLFQRYFSCKVIDIPGHTYPVKMHFLDDIKFLQKNPTKLNSNINQEYFGKTILPKVIKLIQWMTANKPSGSILCFLPGWQEIKYIHKLLQQTQLRNLLILPLHSKVPLKMQQMAFNPVPENVRKIILATDIAESSITVPDIRYVIDTAIKKDNKWDDGDSAPGLEYSLISKANLHQRKGRAGRLGPGESYHLITKEEYDSLDLRPIPEIHKTILEDAVITIKRLSSEKAYDFFNSMPEAPSSTSLFHAVQNLEKLGILDTNENLTNLGMRVSYLSLEPRLSKAIILSCVFQCLRPIVLLTCLPFGDKIAVSLNEESNNTSADKMQKLNFHTSSDHIALVEHFNYWTQDRNFGETPNSYFSTINKYYDLHMSELENSLMLQSEHDDEFVNMFSKNNELIRAVLFAATNHILKRSAYAYKRRCFTKHANILISENNEKVILTSESVNYKRREWPTDILTYIRKYKLPRGLTVSETSMLTSLSVLLFSGGEVFCNTKNRNVPGNTENVSISISDINNIELYCDRETAELLLKLRSVLWKVANYIIDHEGIEEYENNLKLVKSYRTELMNLITSMLYETSKHIDNAE